MSGPSRPDVSDAPAGRGTTGAGGARRTDTRDPRRARERALTILFQADVRGQDPAVLLERLVEDRRAWALLDADAEVGDEAAADLTRTSAPPLDGFTRSLVAGVAAHRDDLDALIQTYARRWAVGRMPAVDRCALRLGAYELAHESTSPAVVINEVIEFVKARSTDDSGRYVNGVLESVRRHLAAGRPVTAVHEVPPDEIDDLDPPAPDPSLPDDAELVAVETPEAQLDDEDPWDADDGEVPAEDPSGATEPDGGGPSQGQLF